MIYLPAEGGDAEDARAVTQIQRGRARERGGPPTSGRQRKHDRPSAGHGPKRRGGGRRPRTPLVQLKGRPIPGRPQRRTRPGVPAGPNRTAIGGGRGPRVVAFEKDVDAQGAV